MKKLGKAHELPLATVFDGEAREFTPWLSENLERLATELGFELQTDEIEVSVGAFKADIRAKTTDDKSVVIENQFNATDHSHLGQLLTYASGLNAEVVIWVAERVREEHRAAIDWLNDKAADADFFAVEARAVKIDDSLPAIFWDVVSSPNTWTRTSKKAREAGELGSMDRLRVNYWAALNDLIEEKNAKLTRYKPAKESWQGGSIGKGDIWLNTSISVRDNWVRVEIYLGGEKAQVFYDYFREQRTEIESSLGYALNWDPLKGKKACRISVKTDAAPSDGEDWQRQHEWIVEKRLDFERVFRPLVRKIIL